MLLKNLSCFLQKVYDHYFEVSVDKYTVKIFLRGDILLNVYYFPDILKTSKVTQEWVILFYEMKEHINSFTASYASFIILKSLIKDVTLLPNHLINYPSIQNHALPGK